MRTSFIIVGLLGLLLMSLGAIEFHAVNDEYIRMTTFGQTQYNAVYNHKLSPTYKHIFYPDHTIELEIISTVIFFFSGAILTGIGFICGNKPTKSYRTQIPA